MANVRGRRFDFRPHLTTSYRPGVEILERRVVLQGDPILRWNAVALDLCVADHEQFDTSEQYGPTRTSRALGIVHAAMYDAVNAIDGTHEAYLTDVRATPGTSLEAAVARAAHDTLVALYPSQAARVDQALADDLAAVPDGPAEDAGVALGALVAQNILAARSGDGSALPEDYTPTAEPGFHQLDPLHLDQGFLTPRWGEVTPFAIESSDQFRAPPPPALDSAEYAAAYREVMQLGGDGVNSVTIRTEEQTQIGTFWGYDASPGICTPPRLYNQVARHLAEQMGNDVVQNARMFALVNLALADAGITAWETKYFYSFWRPVIAIRAGMDDGNPDTAGDPNWTPLGAPASNNSGTNFTPPFPAYTSGHATFGGALFSMLKNYYGRDDIAFTITSDELNGSTIDQSGEPRPETPRSFTSFSEAMEENGMSRIYLGIHWRFDKEQGIAAGSAVADYVFENFLGSRISDNERYVRELYRTILGREGDITGVRNLTAALDAGLDRTGAAFVLRSSAEFAGKTVEEVYLSLLDRQADTTGKRSATEFLQNGGNVRILEAVLLGSVEYYLRNGPTATSYLTALYQDALGRDIDAAALPRLDSLIANGLSRTDAALLVLESDENLGGEVAVEYGQTLKRDAEGTEFSVALGLLRSGNDRGMLRALLMGTEECFDRANR